MDDAARGRRRAAGRRLRRAHARHRRRRHGVLVGLAAQQTFGNVIAGTMLASAQPFGVGERVRMQGGPLAGTVEATVSSLGLLYTVLAQGEDAIMIPNSVVMNVPSCRCASPRAAIGPFAAPQNRSTAAT